MHVTEDDTWDAGDMGCGELVLALRMRLHEMPGRMLKVIATDAGAPEDLPALGHSGVRGRNADSRIVVA